MAKQGFSPEFELFVADYYRRKMESCKTRGIDFKLNLVSVRNLLRTRKCPYTGKELTVPRPGKQALTTDITIDRIDNTKGYQKGNVMAISNRANNLKSIFENPEYGMDFEQAAKVMTKISKRVKKAKETNQ